MPLRTVLLDIDGTLIDSNHAHAACWASSSEAKHSKPDQDIIEAALSKSNANAAEALMLGDTPYDIEAAQRAHVPTVALRCGGWHDEALRHAIAIYDSPSDLLARYTESPFAPRPHALPEETVCT